MNRKTVTIKSGIYSIKELQSPIKDAMDYGNHSFESLKIALDYAMKRAEIAEAENVKLRAVLEKYSVHQIGCHKAHHFKKYECPCSCNCGLSEALKEQS